MSSNITPFASGSTPPGQGLKKRKVAIATDSATALPYPMIEKHSLHVAKMEVTIGSQTFEDGPGNGLEDFYTRLRTAEKLPTTSAPKPKAWLEAFRSAAGQGESIFCVTLSSNLSAAYDAARVAAELAAKEMPGVEIRVFNSMTAAGSEALIVLECARMAARGASLDEIHTRAKALAGQVRLLAYLDTLEYIHRGGRVPRIAVWATNFFNIKPVMEFSGGKVGAIARPRSRPRAFKRILSETVKDMLGKRAHVNVMHADAEAEAKALAHEIDERLECVELFTTQFHPFMGAHTGPGLVGVSYWGE
jgi:DegV family protein with EDD domain